MSAISQWTLDEGTGTSVGDSVGSNTGTLNNSLGWSVVTAPLTFSNPGSLYAASAYYVSLANDFSVGPSSSYSVSLWARWPNTPTDRNPAFAFDSTDGDFGFSLGSTADGNGKIALEVSEYANGYQSCQGPTIVPDQWYHLCAVLRSGGTADLYVDGVYENTVTYDAFTTALAAANGNGRTIGGEKYNGSVYWQASCYVDDVRTFDHELSGSEITALAARAGGAAPNVSLTASTNSIAENGGSVTITALLDSTASDTVTIAVGFAGTAATGSDYTVSTNSIAIASGQTSGSLTVTAINDSIYEGNEQFTASITSVTGGGASASSTSSDATVTIVDDESQPTVSISASAAAIAENGGTAAVIATLSNASFQDVTVGLGFSGSSTLNTDYSASTNSVIITAGQTSGSISITAINDSIYDPGETVVVGIDSVTNGTENGNQSVSITITDDEVAPVVNLSASTTSIVENVGTVYVVARLDKQSALSTTIGFGFSGGATINVDYSASTNSLAISAGQTSGSISISAIQDSTYEGNETILVGITSVTNGSVGATSSLSVTLTDDDSAPPVVSLTSSLTSIDENAGSAIVRTLMSATHSATVTVTLGFAGTATNTTDYTRTTDTIVMTSGQTSGSIGITSIQDVLSESNETITVSIASVTSGISSSSDTITITIVNEGVVTNEVGMASTKRSLIAKNAPPIEAVVSCGVISDWIDICTAPEASDNSGGTVVSPGSISRTDQKWIALCSLGSRLLVRLKYDTGVTLPTSPVVQVFGKDSQGTISPLTDASGTHEQTLTVDLTNDVTDGAYKYTTAKTLNIAGCKDVLAAIKTAFAGTGTTNNSAIQVRVI